VLSCATGARWTDQSEMGNSDSKLHFRKAVIQLTTKTQVRFTFYLTYVTFITLNVCVELKNVLKR